LNKSTLPVAARLQSLQTAARFAPGGGRVIAEAHDRSPVTQLLRAANETVLGRSLRFSSDSGPSITLDIAGRRFLRLTAAEGLPGAEACLAAEALEDEHKDELIKLIQSVAAPRHQLTVTSGPIGVGGDGVSVGLPVALIADLLLIELNAIASEEPDDVAKDAVTDVPGGEIDAAAGLLGRFVSGVGSALVAWLITGGEDDGRVEGPEEMVSHLRGFLDDEFDALSQQLDLVSNVPGGPICILLGAILTEGHSLVCARDGAGMLLGVIEGDGTKTVLSAWNAAIR
jgi:hypothetical protein